MTWRSRWYWPLYAIGIAILLLTTVVIPIPLIAFSMIPVPVILMLDIGINRPTCPRCRRTNVKRVS